MSKRMQLGLLLVPLLFFAPTTALSSSTWVQLTPTGGPPPARFGHTSVYDAASNRLIVFGGCSNVPGGCNTFGRGVALNDLWVLSNANGQGGTPTWTQLTPTGGPPPPRFFHVAVYDPFNNRMVIWGGDSTFGSLPDLTDVWVLTNANGLDKATGLPATPNWSQLFPTGGPPPSGVSSPGRENATGVYDSITNRMIVFGGVACDPCTSKNDVWVLTNPNGLGGTPQWLQLFPTGGPPAPRGGHSAVYDAAGNRMIIFGAAGYTNDTWVLANASGFDRATGMPTTPAWTQLTPTGTLPPARSQNEAAYDAATNRMVIFGGVDATSFFNDVWLLDNANGAGAGVSAWSQILPTGAAPAPRYLFSRYETYDAASKRMLVFGGNSFGVSLNDSWVLTEASGVPAAPPTWTQKCVPTGPQAGYYPAMAYDTAHAQSVLFGGTFSNFFPSNETWTWNGSTWTKQSPATIPPARVAPAMAYDAARGQVVLFGGSGGSPTPLGDTWVWDGVNWTQKASGPGPRFLMGMAYDSARQQVVLFGGSVGTPTPLGDTWVWDGTSWTQKFPLTTPGLRSNFRLTYDEAHSQVVLFGGWNRTTLVNETWVWDGTTWTQKFPVNSPPARQDFATAYDTNLQRVVLFSGIQPPSNPVDDITWLWDGTNWTNASPAVSPPARGGAAMAYDAARSQVALFGGVTSSQFFTDTWVLGAPASTTCPIGPPPTIVSVSPSSGTQGQTITNFTVNGNNFDPAAVLFFSGNPTDFTISYISRTATQIVASISIAPAAALVVRDVTVKNPDGQQATRAALFTVLAAPPVTHTLTVASTNPTSGVAITVSPSDNNGQGNGATQFTRSYNNGALVTLSAPLTASGNNFSNWTGCDSTTGFTCTVTMSGDRTVTANYVTPLPTCSVSSIQADKSFSNGVIDANISVGASPCQFTITLRNLKNYWTNFTLSTVGFVTVTPVGGDLNLYAKYGLLPPSSFLPLPPGKSVSFTVQVSMPGQAVTIFADPTINTGIAAGVMNIVQSILNVLPLGSLPVLVIDDFQKIAELLPQVPDLEAAISDLFQNPPHLVKAALDLFHLSRNSGELITLAFLGTELGFNIGSDVIKSLLRSPFRILNSLVTIFGNLRTAFFQYPAGSIAFVAR